VEVTGVTWNELAEFIATLPADRREGSVTVYPDPLKVPEEFRWNPGYVVSAAMPPTAHMGGPYLLAYQPGA
jgi:hypothetical protein